MFGGPGHYGGRPPPGPRPPFHPGLPQLGSGPTQLQGWRGGQGGMSGMPVLIPQFGLLPFGGGPVPIMSPGFAPPGGPGRARGGRGDQPDQAAGGGAAPPVRALSAQERAEADKWREERRRNFPSAANLAARAAEATAREARGELDPRSVARRARLREVVAQQRALGLDRKAGTDALHVPEAAEQPVSLALGASHPGGGRFPGSGGGWGRGGDGGRRGRSGRGRFDAGGRFGGGRRFAGGGRFANGRGGGRFANGRGAGGRYGPPGGYGPPVSAPNGVGGKRPAGEGGDLGAPQPAKRARAGDPPAAALEGLAELMDYGSDSEPEQASATGGGAPGQSGGPAAANGVQNAAGASGTAEGALPGLNALRFFVANDFLADSAAVRFPEDAPPAPLLREQLLGPGAVAELASDSDAEEAAARPGAADALAPAAAAPTASSGDAEEGEEDEEEDEEGGEAAAG
ncbi:hypothetical protein WJX81_004274 [Elliptochloris bilobata]|uniref:FMR1-interacting protein 1 conserved domain-containing protein n=1 Tax=Elliptochloris bilobata TaxID=381761 RepID=A0AAW1RWJ7_9CHLO